MNEAHLRPYLAVDTALSFFDTLPSTNTLLLSDAKRGAPDKSVYIAAAQSEGRGRRGHSFICPRGAGLYFSLLLRGPIPKETVPLLTPYAAVTVARAIEALCPLSVGIKWVNDLFVNGKKVCGILTEGEFREDGALSFAVVGIGLNRTPAALPQEVAAIAASLGDFGAPPEEAPLLAEIVNRFYLNLPHLFDASFLGEYRRRSFLLGKRVYTVLNGKEVQGIARDIDESGALLVETGAGILRLQAGEVSVKT